MPAETAAAEPLRVRAGAISALRLFDVSYAIDLALLEKLWRDTARPASTRSRLSTTPAKAIAFDVPPVLLALGTVELKLKSGTVAATASARCSDFGVIALALRVPAAERSWGEFNALMTEVDQAVGPNASIDLWSALLQPLCEQFRAVFVRPGSSLLQEDYLIGIVQQWNRPMSAAAVREQVDLAALLSGEQRPLSEASRRELLSESYSYYEDDLVVLTWDRAFIYEPRQDTDVADVLEVANAQLLEQRYYDELLDDELPRMYDLVEQTRRARYWLAPRRYAHLARRLHMLVAEVTELTEKVDNALQVTEDVYLARVYAAALDTLRVHKIGAAVDRKLAIIRDTYAALYDEASSSRGELMELTIVLLIVLELILALLR
ncbi:MAG TPA: hypothetical protein VHE37_13945 [Nevskiaceae bacterium]|nr:hypothetical protein [Nevskiaceae bacterium]